MLDMFSSYSGTELILVVLAFVLVIAISFTLHEFAHAYVAFKQGDPTPKRDGRITLNPLNHIDVVGFIMVMFFGFGWARPVATQPAYYKKGKLSYFYVAVAGVVVNIIIAFLAYGASIGVQLNFVEIVSAANYEVFFFLNTFLSFLASLNVLLFVLNLLPVAPLDGFKVVEAATKPGNRVVAFMRKYSLFIAAGAVMLLSVTNFLQLMTDYISTPMLDFWIFIWTAF